ncbi:MAG: hypothetical protein JNK53_01855, partial [Phycisphaerae bacterium]|nr:hypothetical protein [Phycisphaerae bacterium]
MFAILLALTCATQVHAQGGAGALAQLARPANDPAAQLQTLLNVQDAEYKRR